MAIAAVTTLIVVLGAAFSDQVFESPPRFVEPEPPAIPALTRHLVLVLSDGLRYDVGVDPERMPHFARRMRDEAHAEVWAGRVTMTSAAVLSLGTGQRADVSQIVLNLNTPRTRENDLFTNLRSAGLRAVLAGDETWIQAFGDLDAQIVDAHGLAINVDNSVEMVGSAVSLALAEPRPNLLVAHFVAPDHQGHAHRVMSDTYRSFIARYDASLERLLAALPADTTVISMSDHGMLDNGAHGVDSTLERRTPLYAYGPGIRRGAALVDVDQNDLSATFAVLLGAPGPARGRGTAVTELLDLDAEAVAKVACADARRVMRVAASEGRLGAIVGAAEGAAICGDGAARPEARSAEGRRVVRAWDQVIERSTRAAGRTELGVTVGAGLLFLALSAWLVGRALGAPISRAMVYAAFGAAACAISAGLTYFIDRMLPPFNDTRAVFLVVAHLPLFAGVIRPGVSTWMHARSAAPALALVPGAVVCSYTISTPLYSFLSLIAVGAVWLLAPGADLRTISWLGPGLRRVGWAPALALLLGLGCLYPFARVADDPVASLALPPGAPLALGFGAVAAWLLLGHRLRGGRLLSAEAAAAIVLACATVGLRRWMPSTLGLACLVVTPLVTVLAFRARRMTLASGLAFASYGWVSRDDELLAVAGAALVVEAIAASVRAGATPDDSPAERRPWALGTLTVVLFATSFLCRVGLQRGLDLRLMDHAAGAFGDPSPSELRLGLAIGWKFMAPELLILWLFLRGLPRDLARGAALLYVVVSVMRVGTLALTLAVSRSSYWTSFRVLSDLPLAVLMSLAAAIGLGALARAQSRPAFSRLSGSPESTG